MHEDRIGSRRLLSVWPEKGLGACLRQAMREVPMTVAHGGGHEQHGHGHGPAGAPPPRIRSTTVMTTVGGLEAHPLFAKALLDRAKERSRNPKQETVILVAHGSGEDGQNERWLRNLEVVAKSIRANGGAEFRAIRVGTWREDWPDKREPWVRDIRRWVEEASQDGGRAIVIPARTTGQGPERKLLDGLTYDHGSGFAPHHLFAEWVEGQIQEGMTRLGVDALGEVAQTRMNEDDERAASADAHRNHAHH